MDAVGCAPSASAPAPQASEHSYFWAKPDFSFRDLLDVINPLQHIPVVSTVYRWITGDAIGNLPRMAGDFLFGGPIGLAMGAVSTVVKELSGKDPGEHVVALLTDAPDASKDAAPTTAVAAATPDLTTAASAAAQIVVPPQAVPDHPPMPLNRPVVAAASPAEGSGTTAPARAAMQLPGAAMAVTGAAPAATPNAAQEFLKQRDAASRRFAGGAAPRSAPVPLQLSGFHPQPKAAASPQDSDFSRQMMSALDKYSRLQTDRGAARSGSVLDLSH